MKVRNSQRGCALKRSKKEEEILEHWSLEQLNAKADREWKSNGALVFGAAQCKSGQRMDVKWNTDLWSRSMQKWTENACTEVLKKKRGKKREILEH